MTASYMFQFSLSNPFQNFIQPLLYSLLASWRLVVNDAIPMSRSQAQAGSPQQHLDLKDWQPGEELPPIPPRVAPKPVGHAGVRDAERAIVNMWGTVDITTNMWETKVWQDMSSILHEYATMKQYRSMSTSIPIIHPHLSVPNTPHYKKPSFLKWKQLKELEKLDQMVRKGLE